MSISINEDFVPAPKISFPNFSLNKDTFNFGLEGEFLIVNKETKKPLWHKDFTFKELNSFIHSIDFRDVEGDFSSLEIEHPMTAMSPFVIEGYHMPDENFNMVDVLPKGLEIRTPVTDSISSCLHVYKTLFNRLQLALNKKGLMAISLSHHPIETTFSGPQNKRRHDWWQWAQQVMTTYGPDINVSIPSTLLENFDREDFDQKVNYYAPAFTALSVGSPFYKGGLWEVDGQIGKSYRTHKRSIVAPPIEYHGGENNRMEFKVFEMSPYLKDIEGQFLLFLALLLDRNLLGRADNATRIYQMGDVAKFGLDSKGITHKLNEIFNSSAPILSEYGFELSSFYWLENRFKTKNTLADELISLYKKEQSLYKCLEFLSYLR